MALGDGAGVAEYEELGEMGAGKAEFMNKKKTNKTGQKKRGLTPVSLCFYNKYCTNHGVKWS